MDIELSKCLPFFKLFRINFVSFSLFEFSPLEINHWQSTTVLCTCGGSGGDVIVVSFRGEKREIGVEEWLPSGGEPRPKERMEEDGFIRGRN